MPLGNENKERGYKDLYVAVSLMEVFNILRYMNPNVHSNIIYNSQDMEKTLLLLLRHFSRVRLCATP